MSPLVPKVPVLVQSRTHLHKFPSFFSSKYPSRHLQTAWPDSTSHLWFGFSHCPAHTSSVEVTVSVSVLDVACSAGGKSSTHTSSVEVTVSVSVLDVA